MTTPSSSPHEVTQLLIDWSRGDQAALYTLMPRVYEELRQIAHRYMRRESAGHTLQTTALINEAYLRLIEQQRVQWHGRAHFFAIAAQLMRRILVDFARRKSRAKRGGGALRVSLNETAVSSEWRGVELLALDDALQRLAVIDPRKGRVVELRFFGGLSIEGTAEIINVTPMTVVRDWKTAKAWLHREISHES
jgi:RNA polymerase sigma factor (TIGR02999 family)